MISDINNELGMDLILVTDTDGVLQVFFASHIASEENGAVVTIENIDEDGYKYNYGLNFTDGPVLTRKEADSYLIDRLDEGYRIFKMKDE